MQPRLGILPKPLVNWHFAPVAAIKAPVKKKSKKKSGNGK